VLVGRRRPRLAAEGGGGAKEQRAEDRKPKTGDSPDGSGFPLRSNPEGSGYALRFEMLDGFRSARGGVSGWQEEGLGLLEFLNVFWLWFTGRC